MTAISQPERATQNRVARLFRDELGYRHLGDWSGRAGNSAIEEGLLTPFLAASGHTPAQINRALHTLRTEANHPGRSLYASNEAVYSLLRYGVQVKLEAGALTETVQLIDWRNPEKTTLPSPKRSRSKAVWRAGPTSCCMSTASPSACWN